MTTLQLFHRIGRKARGGDFTQLSMSEQGDLMEAANAALIEAYNLIPTCYKETPEGFVLPAPATVNVGVTQHSATLTSAAFTSAQIGRSVVITGDANWNTVVDTDELLNPYMGETGTASATVYGDAVYSSRYPFDRIIGNPFFPNRGTVLLRNRNMAGAPNGDAAGWFLAQTTGEPAYWWVQMLGKSQGKDPMLVLRFSPAPSRAYAITVRMSYWPKRFTLADYTNATTISIPDQFIENGIIPLAFQALMLTPVWVASRDDAKYDAAADRARLFLKNQVAQLGAPNNRIFTPVGY